MEELEDYKQPNGLYSNQKGPQNDSSGNCIAITSIALWLAYHTEEFRRQTNIDKLIQIERSLEACQVKSRSGLLNRSPTKLNDQEGWDDYVCLSAAGSINKLNLELFQNIATYGRVNYYNFNNVEPGKFTMKSFLGRYPQFIAHFKFCNNEIPSIFHRILWCFGVFFSSFSQDHTSILLNFMFTESVNELSFMCLFVSAFWRYKMRNNYIKLNLAYWLSVKKDALGTDLPNLDHPIVKYWC